MSRACRCEVCDGVARWSITRRGDVVESWACALDLDEVCRRLQRAWEVTELVVKDFAKSSEWAGISAALEVIANPVTGASLGVVVSGETARTNKIIEDRQRQKGDR